MQMFAQKVNEEEKEWTLHLSESRAPTWETLSTYYTV